MPASGGITNARSLAKVLSIEENSFEFSAKIAAVMAKGGKLQQIKFLSENSFHEAHQPFPTSWDHVLHRNVTYTHGGWGLFNHSGIPYVGWGGSGECSSQLHDSVQIPKLYFCLGGSIIQWSVEKNIGIGYVPNGMLSLLSVSDFRSQEILEEIAKVVSES